MARGVFLVVVFCFVHLISQCFAKELLYTNTWVVHTEKGKEYVDKIARKRGFINHGQQGGLEGYYLLEHKLVSKRTRRSLGHHTEHFLREPHIKYAQQQKILSRQKRGYFPDPMFHDQWYLQNTGQSPGPKGLDINVLPVWKKNISGKNVVVTILDDGIEYTHPDLKDNYEASASWDFNSRDSDPMPRYTSDKVNKHGTRCAGEVAGKKGNSACGVGVAYNARIGGVRMLDGDVTDSVEGGSLSLKSNFIDIYSSSWGPDDDGRTVDGPGPLAKKAFRDGIRKGRKGLGSIFVWATGNGGRFNDYCSCDGYITSIFTISIGAVNDRGKSPWYAEPCPSTLAVTYSSGEPRGPDLKIVTTDLDKKCTKEHTGTSAAAPLAAGIFALVLEANPKLSWRDLQHLIVNTSRKTDPKDPEWKVNGAGLHVNNKYGFGVLDTAALVDAATDRRWKTTSEQHICRELGASEVHLIPKKGTFTSTLFTDGCAGKANCITRLEHVRVYITISHPRRGDLSINLTSPSGITHELLKPRDRDFSGDGFISWPFMTVFSWGENPRGLWTLKVTDTANFDNKGTFRRWTMRLYGTCEQPKPKITPFERKNCDENCKKGCDTPFSEFCFNCTQFCHCGTGQCVQLCNEEDDVNEKAKHCVPPEFHIHNKDKPTDEDSGELSTFVKWLIIFSLLAILVATVLIMYLFKTSGKFCWARPAAAAVEKNSAPPRHLVRNSTPNASIRSVNTEKRRSEPRAYSYPKSLDSNEGPSGSNMIYI